MKGPFGLEFNVFFWETLAILLLFFLLYKFFLPPILKVLRDREKFINDSVYKAAKIEEESKNIEREKEECKREIELLKEKALHDVAVLKSELIETAKRDAENLKKNLILRSKDEAENYKNIFFEKNREEVCKIVITLVEELLKKQQLDQEDKKKEFLNTLIDNINSVDNVNQQKTF